MVERRPFLAEMVKDHRRYAFAAGFSSCLVIALMATDAPSWLVVMTILSAFGFYRLRCWADHRLMLLTRVVPLEEEPLDDSTIHDP